MRDVPTPEKSPDIGLLQDQFRSLLSTIETIEYEILSRDEEEEDSVEATTPIEKIRALNLPRGHFERYFQHLKSQRPLLHRHISQHSVFHPPTKLKKKKNRRDKKKEKREKRTLDSIDVPLTIIPDEKEPEIEKVIFLNPSRSTESLHSMNIERKRDVTVTIFVSKCIAEGTLNSYLVAFTYLMYLWQQGDVEVSLLPLGNVINFILGTRESKATDEKRDMDGNLRKFVLTSKNLSFRTESVSDASGDNSRSMDDSNVEDAVSQADSYFHSAYSETGSNIGSVTVEVGAEVPPLEYELSEDEMLAQALAMSLAVESVPTTKEVSKATVENVKLPSTEKGSLNSDAAKSKQHSDEIAKTPKPLTDPVSTFGPIENGFLFDDIDISQTINISTLSTMMALLMVISSNFDQLLNEHSNPELLVRSNDFVLKQSGYTKLRPVHDLVLQPNSATFHILEYILEVFFDRLCETVKGSLGNAGKLNQNVHTVCWFLTITMKVLRGSTSLSRLLGNTNMIFSNMPASDIAVGVSYNNLPNNPSSLSLIDRLTQHLVSMMHVDTLKIDDQVNPIELAFQVLASYEARNSDQQFPLEYFHHALRIQATLAFVEGFDLFCNAKNDRECVLRNLLTTTFDNQNKFCVLSFPMSKEFVKEYYLSYLLYHLLMVESSSRNYLNLFSEDERLLDPSDATSTQISFQNIESKIRFFHYPYNIEDSGKFSEPILTLLFRRVRHVMSSEPNVDKHLEKNQNFDSKFNKKLNFFWGELSVMASVHNRLSRKFLESNDQTINGSVRFNSKVGCSNLSFSEEDKIVCHKGPKVWTSVILQRGVSPMTGIYDFMFRIDKCDRGQFFLGIGSADCVLSLYQNHYVGCNEVTWGLMGTGSLYHNGFKLKQDYGSIITNRSTVKMRYDSMFGTLSFSIGENNLGVAFCGLPHAAVMFPMISLHDKDDKVTLLGCSYVSTDEVRGKDNNKAMKFSEAARSDKMKHDIVSFIRHSESVLSFSDDLLSDSESQNDNLTRQLHPLLGLIVPSLMSSVLLFLSKPQYHNLISLHLLPYITVFTKRLYSFYESLLDNIPRQNFVIFPMVPGEWKFRSGANSNSFPAQEYTLKFENSLNVFEEKLVEGDDFKAGTQPWSVLGAGKGTSKSVRVIGTQHNTCIKFVEDWESGGACIVDGKLSLCGTFFNGKYSDPKSGKSGSLEGLLVSPLFGIVNQWQDTIFMNNIAKLLTLSSMVCGKLCGTLVVGYTFRDELTIKSQVQISGSDDVDNAGFGDSEDSPTVRTEIEKWVQSDLFSNGFPLDESTYLMFTQRMESFFSANQELGSTAFAANLAVVWKSFAEISDPIHSYKGITDWWIRKTFPEIFQSEECVKTASTPTLLNEITSGTGNGLKLDEFVSHHSSPSAFMKVGGEPILIARRLITASLIKHSGTLPLCQAEVNCLLQGHKSLTSSRPHTILIEVWKAAQRMIESLIKQRQRTGYSYATVSKSICAKSELLLKLNCSDSCTAVSDSLEMIATDSVLKEASQSEVDSDIQKECLKLIGEVVDFLMSGIRNVDEVKSLVFQNYAKAILRTGGFRAILLLLNKCEEFPLKSKEVTLPALSSLSLQPIVMEYLVLSLHGSPDTFPSQSTSTPWTSAPLKSEDTMIGHYMNDLYCLTSNLRKCLRNSFENVYEFNTQLLSRCTWLGDKDGQYSALSAWAISVSPSEHIFLNRIGIFRVLQTVLDDVRSASLDLSKKLVQGTVENFSNREMDFEALSKIDTLRGPFALTMMSQAIKKLSQLTLRVVHSLASQVAFAKDTTSNLAQSVAPKLVRMISGPDTLSVSLFEMLYSELFSGIKRLISQAMSASSVQDKKPSESNLTSNDKKNQFGTESEDDSLDGEQHIDRILKLLFFVSTSRTCHKSLSGSKWLSLLIAALGCGSLPIQRRVFRLLRRIVSNMHPQNFSAFVPSFFSSREEFTSSESPLDEEDISSYKEMTENAQSGSIMSLFSNDGNAVLNAADRLILLLLEAISVISPLPPLSESPTSAEIRCHHLIAYLRNNKLSGFISAEALVFLRVLTGMPTWRSQIFSVVKMIFDLSSSRYFNDSHKPGSDMSIWLSIQYINLLTSSLSLCGGYLDRLRPGGMVTLKPFTLASISDSFGNKLAGTIHSTGMLVSQSPSTSSDSVEVVLMERGMRFVKPSDTSDQLDQKTIHFTTSVSGSIPVRAMRLASSDVFPSYDVPFLPDIFPIDSLGPLTDIVTAEVIPWVYDFLETQKSYIASSNVTEQVEFRSRRVTSTESGDRESGDSENEDNYRENEENEEEDVDVGSEIEDADQEKDDEYQHVSINHLVEKYDGTTLDAPDTSSKLAADTASENSIDISEVLRQYVRVASFRAFSNLMLNDNITSTVIETNLNTFEDILRLSIVETQCGGLHILESAEEKWISYWDGLCAMYADNKPKTTVLATPKMQSISASSADSELLRQLRNDAGDRGSLAEASPFASYLLGRTIDPAAKAEAISQMMDMGIPREWCETSLRRCRYNIEMAINMCFEHGEDMGRFVAEDSQAMLAVQSSRDRESGWRRRYAEDSSSSSSIIPTAASLASLSRALSRSRANRQGTSDAISSVRQLLDMGFPQSWCARAMEQSNQDVNAALAWILSHGEDLTSVINSQSLDSKSSDDVSPTVNSDTSTDSGFNPLESVSGIATITTDLICSVTDDGFPSVGCRGFPVSSGKWYYEMTLLSSGCIQIGWADSSYVGGTSGEGVGDDSHSWAFDGWRTYIWHEISTPWGARWNTGDVVCCSVDIENKIMSFTLNGYGEEIDMGVAFSNFKFQGGLYPCVSFNKKERVQFNFGASTFKYQPPAGYTGFIHHVFKVRSDNSLLFNLVTNNIFKNLQMGKSSSRQRKFTSPSTYEDALEESVGEKTNNSLRRYFPDESGRSINSSRENVKFPSASLPSLIPNDPRKLFDLLASATKDLCILYARQASLRIFHCLPRLSGTSSDIFCNLLSKNDPQFSSKVIKYVLPTNEKQYTTSDSLTQLETLIMLFRICGIHTARTKIYLHTLSLSPMSVTPHHLLGSFTSVGGAPFFEGIRGAMISLLRYSRKQAQSKFVVEVLLNHLLLDCLNSIRRDQNFDYRIEGGLSPVQVLSDGISSQSSVLATNNLNYSVWTTGILLEQLASDMVSCQDRNEVIMDVGCWLLAIAHSWSICLRSPSILVKTCACQMLSGVVQEHLFSSSKFVGLPRTYVQDIISNIPVDRMKKVIFERLDMERMNHPISSEYLQALLELYIAVTQCEVEIESKRKWDNIPEEIPQLESKNDLESSKFNWEAASGRLFSDADSAIVWTGSVVQHEVENLPLPDKNILERVNFPPELLIGCKVTRKIAPKVSKDASVPTEEESSNKSDVTLPISSFGIEPATLQRLHERPSEEEGSFLANQRFLERFKANQILGETSRPVPDESPRKESNVPEYEVGTVIEVSSWEDDYPGTARVVKWDSGTVEKVRWGAKGNIYDVTHAKVVNGKVVGEHPRPMARSAKTVNQSFGVKLNYGVLIRLRKIPRTIEDDKNVVNRFIGVMEWPDFNAIVGIDGFEYISNEWLLRDVRLLSGPEDANWCVRFGENKWRPGTTYHFALSSTVSDPSDSLTHVMKGTFRYEVKVPFLKATVFGDITIQRSRLFYFDEKFHSASVAPSWDRLSITKNSSGSTQGCGFATIGFSTGVHYWEYKVEQAEVGSVFIGVSEKPGPPALAPANKCNRWMGCGFVSHRASYRAATSNTNERVAVYGDYFHTGDIIGVLLDMNRGRLSFFLDGMKYGEHTLADLGEAFDGLSSPLNVKPKVLYPVVGLSRHQDRVTITPRWLSSIGCHPEEELKLISRAWSLMASWSIDRPTSRPSDINLWAYRDAWRDWRRWISGKFLRVRTRCKPAYVLVDISPLSCVEASVRLGLSTALFHGDRVSFDKSSGRRLEVKEEAVILGVYQGQLWFRHDSQQSSSSLSESVAVAWSLAQNDVEGMSIVRRSKISHPFSLPSEIISIELPRIKAFHGGLLTLTLSTGAAMRNGLEIDTSDMIREISADTTLYSIESRQNSSNINRHKVIYSGAIGWISERMRGGAEEVIITRPKDIEVKPYIDEAIHLANEHGFSDRIICDDVDNLDHAISRWKAKVTALGFGNLLADGGPLSRDPIAFSGSLSTTEDPFSFESYLSYATTIDGKRNWTVEADMQLAEYMTKAAAKEAVTPQNLTCLSLSNALTAIDSESSPLYKIDSYRAVARASLLRVANQVIGYALPYLDLMQLEERHRRDICGSDDEIELSCSQLPSLTSTGNTEPLEHSQNHLSKTWAPPSWARRLRSMRRVLFGQTKRLFWESVLESTTTFTPMHQDEYEDPREIKTISINRIKANATKLASYSNIHERLKQSVFGQLHKELRNWSDSSYRRSYVGKGHGGQKRSFKVKFLGEGVNDYGGPYRAVYEQIVDELQCDRSLKSPEKSLLPILIPSNNRSASVGSIQDKFLLSTATVTAPAILELTHFFGKLLGMAVRQNLNLALDLSAMVWRPLVRLPLSRAHLETVDSLTVKTLDDMTKKGLQLESSGTYSSNYVPPEWEDLNFMIYLPDGSRIPLLPGGEDIPVTFGNWRQYVSLTERCRLRESVVSLKALRDGLCTVLPIELLPLFTPVELEQIVSGNSNVDISLLRQCTEYEDISPDCELVKIFWEVLEEFTSEERTLFLRFVWARSRMPSSAEDLLMNFKLQISQGDAKVKPDQYLPHAQTCFFSLSLPPYTSKTILKEKLLYAIHNSPNMDADVRLHNADGWADA